MENKECHYCHESKSESQFYWYNKWDISACCLECRKENQNLKLKNLKKCASCHLIKEYKDFYHPKQAYCKKCRLIIAQKERDLLKDEIAFKRRKKDEEKRNFFLGKKYNRLTILSFAEGRKVSGFERDFYLCRCDCGIEKIMSIDSIKGSKSKSCGCLRRENTIRSAIDRRLPMGVCAFNTVYAEYKACAKDREIEFGLDREEFRTLINSNCYYCNCCPENIQTTKSDPKNIIKYSGIDRVNSDIGYYIGNCVPCCKFCNVAKLNYSQEYFLNKIKKIYLNMSLKALDKPEKV